MEDIDGGLHPAVDGQSLDEMRLRLVELLRQLSHKVWDWFELHLVNYLDLLVWWISYSLNFHLVHLILKGENPACMISLKKKKKKNFNVGLYSDIYRLISFKFGMIIQITKLNILMPVWMTLTLIQGQLYKKSKTSVSIFLQI